jgi:hypothetical protein
MNYDGIVAKLVGKLYLFVLNPEDDKMTDGMNISEHKCYKDLKSDQLWVVNVEFYDGTLKLEKIDLNEYIYGNSYGDNDIFIKIKDVQLFTYEKDAIFFTLESVVRGGKFNEISLDLINQSKKIKEIDEIKNI